MVHACNANTWEAVVGGSEFNVILSHIAHSKFKATLSYMNPLLKKQTTKKTTPPKTNLKQVCILKNMFLVYVKHIAFNLSKTVMFTVVPQETIYDESGFSAHVYNIHSNSYQ